MEECLRCGKQKPDIHTCSPTKQWKAGYEYALKTQKENIIMTNVAQEIVTAANAVAPNAPAVEVATAVVQTAIDPSPSNILADIELIVGLIKQLKTALAGTHPSLLQIVKLLF